MVLLAEDLYDAINEGVRRDIDIFAGLPKDQTQERHGLFPYRNHRRQRKITAARKVSEVRI